MGRWVVNTIHGVKLRLTAAKSRMSQLYLLTISKQYEQPVDILGAGGVLLRVCVAGGGAVRGERHHVNGAHVVGEVPENARQGCKADKGEE